jgi:ribosomal 30S subunit maturation factor RimM
VFVPFRRPIVADIDRAARRITIDPPAGLLDV